jgi:trk system potassium uptake protein
VYERLGIPTIATVPWTTDEMLRAIIGGQHSEYWRDPTGRVVLTQIEFDEGWVGHRVTELEAACAARVVYLTRFGMAMLPEPATVVQQGDQVFMAVTDDLGDAVRQAADTPPEGSH